jgi:hypothetical protein
VQQLKDEQLRLANHQKEISHPTPPLLSQRCRATSSSVKEKTDHSAVSHVIHPPSQGQTSPVNSRNLHHLEPVLKPVDSSEFLASNEEPVQLSPAFPISAGHKKDILPAPHQLLDDNNALGIINLSDFPQPPAFRERRNKSPQLSQAISKKPSKNFVRGNTEQTKDLQAPQPHRNIRSDGIQTQNLIVRNLLSIAPSGQEQLPEQKEAALVHRRVLRAVSDSENLSSESQPYELIPFLAERTRQRLAKSEKSQASISSGITRGSPVLQSSDLSLSQDLSRGPQQSSPSSPKSTFPLSSGLDLARLAINDSPYLDASHQVQSFVTELPTPPSDYPPSPEVVSTRSRILPPVTKIVPASPSAFSAQRSFLDNCLTESGAHSAEMDRLQVRMSQSISVRTKAVEDARQMQTSVMEAAKKAGRDPPKYALLELTGKGSFGRVYKA